MYYKDPKVHFENNYKTDEASGCWLWTGYINNRGRACIVLKTTTKKTMYASRFAAHLYHGLDLDNDLAQANHKSICQNHNTCVNPNHIYVGTRGDNMEDLLGKTRR